MGARGHPEADPNPVVPNPDPDRSTSPAPTPDLDPGGALGPGGIDRGHALAAAAVLILAGLLPFCFGVETAIAECLTKKEQFALSSSISRVLQYGIFTYL